MSVAEEKSELNRETRKFTTLNRQAVIRGVKRILRPIVPSFAKELIRKIRLHPYVFGKQRRSYFRNHPIYTLKRGADRRLDEFLDNGMLLLPAYHRTDCISEAREHLLKIAQRLKNNDIDKDWRPVIYQEDGIYRVYDIDKLCPLVGEIMNDSEILDLARRYLGNEMVRMANYLDYKPDIGIHDDTTVPHMDGWQSAVKVFTLFNDIGVDNAPTVYWSGTHKDGEWRRWMDYQNWKGSNYGSAGVCPPHILRDLCTKSGPPAIKKVTVLAPAGSVLLMDARGFHRASNLNAGYRLMTVLKFYI